MKKIGKISINTEKVIKNEELVNLKGGSYTGCCNCMHGTTVARVIVGSTSGSCNDDCEAISNGWYFGDWVC